MSDKYSHPWLAYDRDRMFRDVWLPILMPGQDFSDMSLPLLQDLYPDVYVYGPFWDDWVAWRDAVDTFTEQNTGYHPRMGPANDTEELLSTLVYYYGADSEIQKLLRGDATQPAAYHDAAFLDAREWTMRIWTVARTPQFEKFAYKLYDRVGDYEVAVTDILNAVSTAAVLILLRYLPTDANSEHGRHRVIELHNWFSEMYGLPQLPTK